jgi:hypothetical protein
MILIVIKPTQLWQKVQYQETTLVGAQKKDQESTQKQKVHILKMLSIIRRLTLGKESKTTFYFIDIYILNNILIKYVRRIRIIPR